MCHPLLRVLKLSSLSCRNSWARWSKIHRCVSLTEHVPHLRYCLIDTLSYTGHWTSVLGRSVCVLCTECRSEAAAPWPAGQDHIAEWAAGESCSLREHLLPYQCSPRTYTCLDQFNYLGSESLYLLVCPEKMRRSLVMKPVTSWHCFVLYCAEHLWCDLCIVVLCCQMNYLPTHKHAQIYSPPFLWHFCYWWLMSAGDDYVAYCCSIELTVQNPKFCGGDGERCVVDCWQWQQRLILISILKPFKETE